MPISVSSLSCACVVQLQVLPKCHRLQVAGRSAAGRIRRSERSRTQRRAAGRGRGDGGEVQCWPPGHAMQSFPGKTTPPASINTHAHIHTDILQLRQMKSGIVTCVCTNSLTAPDTSVTAKAVCAHQTG